MTGNIKLYNFRNYRRTTVELKTGINVVIGDNGRGKTNLLEALYFLAMEKAARTNDMTELIRYGEEEAVLEGSFCSDRKTTKRMVINRETGVQTKGGTEEVRAIFFQPDDIWMVKGGPEARRRNIDAATLEIKRGYRDTLREYQRVLKQRNEAIRAVRKGRERRETIRNWNPLLYRYGNAVVTERIKTIREMESAMTGLAERWGRGGVELKYYTSMGEAPGDEKKTLEKIEKMEEAEIRRGISLTGPHRDELLIVMAGKNVRRECSQGEQKIATVMWRIAQAETLREMTHKRVLLLMDDCLSELDEGNRALLMKEFGGWEQTVITSTDDMPEFENTHKIFLQREEAQ